jgi:hypothetical protein
LTVLVAVCALVTSCGLGDDVMATIGAPTTEATPPGVAAQADAQAMTVTDRQRGYLEALQSAGVRPASDLQALTIGLYVCQARAAKQDDQAVWDLVLPMVRSDIRTVRQSFMTPSPAEVDAATAAYVRIATERLC